MVCEVFRTAFSSQARATTPGEVRHCLVAHLVSGSEHRAVPGPGAGEGRALSVGRGPCPLLGPRATLKTLAEGLEISQLHCPTSISPFSVLTGQRGGSRPSRGSEMP